LWRGDPAAFIDLARILGHKFSTHQHWHQNNWGAEGWTDPKG
jgi:hypothetical protein